MPLAHTARRLLPALAVALLFPSPGRAQTWLGGTSGNWNLAANWSGGTLPTSSRNTAIVFSGTPANASTTQNIANPFTLNSITVNSVTVTPSVGGSALTFQSTTGGTLPSVTNNSLAGFVINSQVILADTLTVGGTGSFNLNGTVSGSGGLTKTGAGEVFLGGVLSYTGPTTISQGTLTFQSSAAPTGDVLNNAVLKFGLSTNINYAGTISGSGSVLMTGGNVTLGGVSSYSGGTNLSGGFLTITSDAALGNSSGALTLSGGTLMHTAASSFTVARSVIISGSGATILVNNAVGELILSGSLSGSAQLLKTSVGSVAA